MDVGCCDGNRMNQLRLVVYTDTRFHPEVPLIAFACLVHLRITGLVFVIRRRGGIDNRRIHNRASVDFQAVLGQIHIDQSEHFIAQVVTFH